MITLYSKYNIILFFIFLAIASCKPKSDDTTPMLVPEIKVESSTAGSDAIIGRAKKGDVVTLNISVNAPNLIKELSVFKVVAGADSILIGYPKTSGFDSDKSYLLSFPYTVTTNSGEIILKFQVTDKKAKTASVSYKILVYASTTVPTVQMLSNTVGASFTTGSAVQNAAISFVLKARAGAGLKLVTAKKSVAGIETVLSGYPKTTSFTSDTLHDWTVNYAASDPVGQVILTFLLEDQQSQTHSITYALTIITNPSPYSWNAKLIGAQSNANGSFFSPKTGEVYSTSDSVVFVARKVDFSFAQTGLPNHLPNFISLSERSNQGLKRVTTINRVTLLTVLSGADMDQATFDALTNSKLHDMMLGGSGVALVEIGKFYGFTNQESKTGVIHVTNLEQGSGTNGSVTIDVKFER